ncbi:hypothetical protein JYK14_01285 [Siccirubricoccus sp. KC 17139]|uniref:Uncharacterized protein n=1 Tax=Siccirubricoccus soli TaxID=2899147 RepID=A0ABT1CYS8_9PROT|nr:hypothetical protein [Siccirubricoccus soli]MCO6414813.1 hypothetical protein [Siccirubricoccus soli]MCP2680943.1 hypothetical protein [Siccirubricoccus soli]
MNYAAVIAQIKQHCPMFKNVAGSADVEHAMSNANLPIPCAFVLPGPMEAAPNTESNGLNQIVSETVCVLLVLDNRSDRRGQAAILTLDQAISALHKALLNWRMDPDIQPKGFEFESAELASMDGARLAYQVNYSREIWLTDCDGFEPSSEPLLNIDGHDERLDPSWRFDVSLPQT